MSTPDITKAIPSNDIKNGASLLLVNKDGTEVLFDSSRDTEQGLEALSPETKDRFDDREYYFPSTSSGGGNPFNQSLNTTNSPIFNKVSVSSGITFNDGSTQTSTGVPSNTGLVPNSVSITNMISISQSAYDALVTKDSSTLYVISHPGGGSGPPGPPPPPPPPPPPGG
jgi:hypothetical protein